MIWPWGNRGAPAEDQGPADEELCRRVFEGDRQAFAVLYERHAPSVLRQFLGAGCPAAWAEDGTHEVFLKVWGALEQGHLPGRFALWVHQIAHHVLVDYWRSSAQSRELLVSPPDRPAPERDREAPVLAAHLLAHLEPALREVVILHFYDDLTLTEVSRVLGIPLGTVKSRLARAYRMMAERTQARRPTGGPQEHFTTRGVPGPVQWAVDGGRDGHA